MKYLVTFIGALFLAVAIPAQERYSPIDVAYAEKGSRIMVEVAKHTDGNFSIIVSNRQDRRWKEIVWLLVEKEFQRFITGIESLGALDRLNTDLKRSSSDGSRFHVISSTFEVLGAQRQNVLQFHYRLLRGEVTCEIASSVAPEPAASPYYVLDEEEFRELVGLVQKIPELFKRHGASTKGEPSFDYNLPKMGVEKLSR